MNAHDVLRRYLRQRLEAGEREVFLDDLTGAEALALLEPAPVAAQGRTAAVMGKAHTVTQAASGERARSGSGGLLQALAQHAPHVIGGEQTRVGGSGSAAGRTAAVGDADAVRTDGLTVLGTLRDEVIDCTACRLHEGRQQVVFGEGNPRARVVVVGEAPGREEDRTGRPFVGPAGKLLDLLLLTAGFPREEVYICNVIKCRPPQNRDPQRDEVEACSSHLRRQLDAIQPAVLLALGKFAVQTLAGSEQSISALRGGVHSYHGIPLVVTFHPAFLLRSPQWTRAAWRDLQLLREVLDRGQH